MDSPKRRRIGATHSNAASGGPTSSHHSEGFHAAYRISNHGNTCKREYENVHHHPGTIHRHPPRLRRTLPGGRGHLPRRRDPRQPLRRTLPAVHHPRPGAAQVGRGRPRVHRLRFRPRRADPRPLSPRHRRRRGRADPPRHPLGRLHRRGGALGPGDYEPDAGHRARPFPQQRHRGHADGHAAGSRLHRAQQGHQATGPLPRLARLRHGRLRPSGARHTRRVLGQHGHRPRRRPERGGAGHGARFRHRRHHPGTHRRPLRPTAL